MSINPPVHKNVSRIVTWLPLCASVLIFGFIVPQLTADTLLPTAPTLFQTAPPGLGVTGGYTVLGLGYYGSRFHLDTPATLSRIGGFMAAFDEGHLGLLDAAVVKLSGPTDFPDSDLLTTPDVVSMVQLDLPLDYTEISAPLNVTVDAGWYAILFGTRFPPNYASARLPFVADPGSAQTYIFSMQSSHQWFQTISAPPRIFVEGTPVPVPEPVSGAILGIAALTWICSRTLSRVTRSRGVASRGPGR